MGDDDKGSNKKIMATLECERDELATENIKKSEEIEKMKTEIEKLRKNFDSTAELEKEAAWLRREAVESKSEIEKLRKMLDEKGNKIETVEKEGKELKQENVAMEMKIRKLERRIVVIEMKEVGENSKRVRVEEEMKEKIYEKERKVEELESMLMGKKVEEDKWLKVKRVLENKFGVWEFSLMNMKEKGFELNWPVMAVGSAGSIAMVVVFIRFFFGKRR